MSGSIAVHVSLSRATGSGAAQYGILVQRQYCNTNNHSVIVRDVRCTTRTFYSGFIGTTRTAGQTAVVSVKASLMPRSVASRAWTLQLSF